MSKFNVTATTVKNSSEVQRNQSENLNAYDWASVAEKSEEIKAEVLWQMHQEMLCEDNPEEYSEQASALYFCNSNFNRFYLLCDLLAAKSQNQDLDQISSVIEHLSIGDLRDHILLYYMDPETNPLERIALERHIDHLFAVKKEMLGHSEIEHFNQHPELLTN